MMFTVYAVYIYSFKQLHLNEKKKSAVGVNKHTTERNTWTIAPNLKKNVKMKMKKGG